jgi:hypothetical protein
MTIVTCQSVDMEKNAYTEAEWQTRASIRLKEQSRFCSKTRPAGNTRCATHRFALEIEAVVRHDLVPSLHKVLDKSVCVVWLCVYLGDGAELRVRAVDEVMACANPLLLTRLTVITLVDLWWVGRVGALPLCVDVKQVDEEVVGELARALGEDALV